MFRQSLVAVYLGCAAGCAALDIPARPTAFPPGTSPVAVYAESAPEAAGGLTLRLASISARLEDGRHFSLALLSPQLGGELGAGGLLVAEGHLPWGRYDGVQVEVESAESETEAGRVTLRVADGARVVPARFELSGARGALVRLRLDAREALARESEFEPAFESIEPVQPPVGAMGMAILSESGSALLFDKRRGTASAVVPVGADPAGFAVDRSRRRAYVAVYGEDELAVVDLESATRLQRRPLRGGDRPRDVALTPDGRRLLVVNEGSSSLSFVDPESLVEEDRIAVGSGPWSLRLDPAGSRAFVVCRIANEVSVVDVDSRRLIGSVATEPGPLFADYDPLRKRLVVIHQDAPYVVQLDPGALATERRLYVGQGQAAIRIDPRTSRIFLAAARAAEIEIYDPYSLLPVDRIPLAGTPSHLAIDGEQNLLLAALPAAGRVVSIGLASGATVYETKTPGSPSFVGVAGGR